MSCRQSLAIELIAFLRSGKPRILADGPGTIGVHGCMRPPAGTSHQNSSDKVLNGKNINRNQRGQVQEEVSSQTTITTTTGEVVCRATHKEKETQKKWRHQGHIPSTGLTCTTGTHDTLPQDSTHSNHCLAVRVTGSGVCPPCVRQCTQHNQIIALQ